MSEDEYDADFPTMNMTMDLSVEQFSSCERALDPSEGGGNGNEDDSVSSDEDQHGNDGMTIKTEPLDPDDCTSDDEKYDDDDRNASTTPTPCSDNRKLVIQLKPLSQLLLKKHLGKGKRGRERKPGAPQPKAKPKSRSRKKKAVTAAPVVTVLKKKKENRIRESRLA